MTHRLSPFVAWAILVSATLVSYLSWTDTAGAGPRLAGSIVMLIAFAKAWLIGMRYMELDEARLPLRLAYQGWVLMVAVLLLGMFWIAN